MVGSGTWRGATGIFEGTETGLMGILFYSRFLRGKPVAVSVPLVVLPCC